jgi:GGDEF domain-containing protein
MAARWGGEEFLLYLASIDVETALLRAEQIRSAVSNSAYASGTRKSS